MSARRPKDRSHWGELAFDAIRKQPARDRALEENAALPCRGAEAVSDLDEARKRLEEHLSRGNAIELIATSDVRLLLKELERLKEELCSWHEGDNECCKLRHEAQIAREEALAEVERLQKYIKRVAWAIGSPKDEDRLDEVLPLVLASYRNRGEQAEAELADLRSSELSEIRELKAELAAERERVAELAKISEQMYKDLGSEQPDLPRCPYFEIDGRYTTILCRNCGMPESAHRRK